MHVIHHNLCRILFSFPINPSSSRTQYCVTTSVTMLFVTITDESWMMASVGHCPTESSVITDLKECDRAGRFLGVEGNAHPEPPFLWSEATPKGCSFSRSDHILWFNTKGDESHPHNTHFTTIPKTYVKDKYPRAKAVKSSTGMVYFNGSHSKSNSNAKVSSGSSTYVNRVSICRKGMIVVWLTNLDP